MSGARTATATLALVGALAGCGARSGLMAPCEVDLPVSQPRVLWVVDISGNMEANVLDASGLYIGPYWTVYAQPLLDAVVPRVDDVAAMGLYTFPNVAGIDEEHEQLDWCATPDSLRVTIAPHNAMVIDTALHGLFASSPSYRVMGGPYGSAPLGAALMVAGQSLSGARSYASPTRIVLVSTGETDCQDGIARASCDCLNGTGNPVGNCYDSTGHSLGCNNTVDVTRQVRDLASAGTLTLVVGLPPETDPVYRAFETTTLDDVARAGGAVPAGAASSWVDGLDASATGSAVEAFVDRAAYCERVVPASGRVNTSQGWQLNGGVTGLIARDVTHVDGWDWADTSGQALRVWGDACGHIVTAHDTLRLISTTASCTL